MVITITITIDFIIQNYIAYYRPNKLPKQGTAPPLLPLPITTTLHQRHQQQFDKLLILHYRTTATTMPISQPPIIHLYAFLFTVAHLVSPDLTG